MSSQEQINKQTKNTTQFFDYFLYFDMIFKCPFLCGNFTVFFQDGYRQHTVSNLQMSKHPIGMQLNKAMTKRVSLHSGTKQKKKKNFIQNKNIF